MKDNAHHSHAIIATIIALGGQVFVPTNALASEQARQNTQPQFTPPTIFTPNATAPAEQDVVLLDAEEITQGERPDLVEARGNVQAKNQGRRLIADRLVYDRATGIVTAYGNVAMVELDGSINYADELVVDDKLATGIIRNFSSRFINGGIVAANTAVRRAGEKSVLSQVIYTACPICKDTSPTWEVRARTATQDQVEKVINYQDVVFEVKGVPVFWVPYFRHGDPSAGRQSGFLQPVPGRSSRLGLNWEQPYLYVIDKYSDVVISPIISEYVNPILLTEYRRNFYSGKLLLAGSITNERKFGREKSFYDEADWRSHLFGSGNFRINDVWNWGFGAETASDDLYLARYSINGQGIVRGPVRASSNRLISQLYIEGRDENFYSRALGVAFQDLFPGERRKNTPKVLPSIETHNSWAIGPMNGRLDVNGNLLFLSRIDDRQDSARASLSTNWIGQKILAGGILIEPRIFARAQYYKYSHQKIFGNLDIGNQTVALANAQASIDVRWPLYRQTGPFGITFEPRINLSAGTVDKKNNRITLEDSNGIENGYTSYFAPISRSAIDSWNGGSQVTAGFSLGATGPQNSAINWFVGKQYRTDASPFMDRVSNFDTKDGDYVSNLEISYSDKLSIGGYVRLDGKNLELVRSEVSATLNWWRITADARYHELPLRIGGITRANREIVTSATFKVNDRVKLFANNWRDLRTQTNLHSRVGVMFGDECTDFRVFYEEINTTNRFIAPSQSFKVQVAFKTLGIIDDDPFE